jgi:NADH-quinone oxidoreductase subunit J
MEIAIFLLLSAVTIIAAANIVIQRHPIYSALSLILTFIALAGIYIQMHAEFIAVMQIVVYTGAIMVLFVFVIMLLNPRPDVKTFNKVYVVKYFAIPAVGLFILEVAAVISRSAASGNSAIPLTADALPGNTQWIGKALYTQYALPFEVTSVLLLVAIVGAIIMSRKKV